MSRSMFAVGHRVCYDDTESIISAQTDNSFILRTDQGNMLSVPKHQFFVAYNEGRLRHTVETDEKQERIRVLSPTEMKILERKLAYLHPLRDSDKPGSHQEQQAILDRLGKERGDAPSRGTLYDWWRIWRDSGFNSHALLPPKHARKRTSKVLENYGDLINEVLDEHFLVRKAKNTHQCYQKFLEACRERGVEDNMPPKSTFYEYVKKLHPLDVLMAQQGPVAVRRAGRYVKGEYMPRKVMERVEVDAVFLSVGIVDDDNKFLGTVILYVAIDVFSRAVVGVSYTIAKRPSETTEGYLECLKMVCKYKPREDFIDLKNDWVMFGRPELLVVDPGAALVSKTMSTFIAATNLSRYVTPSRQPWYKPFIESFFRGLRKNFAERLEGYVPKTSKKSEIPCSVEELACMHEAEFQQCLYRYIVDGYHQSSHQGLGGRTPHQVWLEGVEENAPGIVEDLSMLDSFQANEETRVLNPKDGIVIHYRSYMSKELSDFFWTNKNKHKGSFRVTVQWSKKDRSKILVYDPSDGSFFPVPSRSKVAPGTTFEEDEARRLAKSTTGTKERPNPITEDYAPIKDSRKRRAEMDKNKRSRPHPHSTPATAQSLDDLDRQLGNETVALSRHLKSTAGDTEDSEEASNPPKKTPAPKRQHKQPQPKTFNIRR